MKYCIDVDKVLESSEIPAFILSKDYTIIKVNRAFSQMFDAPKEVVEGKKCYEFVHGLGSLPDFCPLQGDSEICPLSGCEREACTEPSPCCPKNYERTFDIQKSPLRGIYIKEFYEPKLKKNLLVTIIPVYDEKGDFFGFLHLVEDRTDEKEFEELLKETVDLYPGLFFINDENFNIVYSNKNLRKLLEKEKGVAKCHYILYGRSEPCPNCPLVVGEVVEDSIIYSPKLSKYFQRYFQVFRTRYGRLLKLTFYHDVTEIVRLFEENPVAMVITKPDGAIVKANRQARALFEIPQEVDVKNLNAKAFWISPEDRELFVSNVLSEGEVRTYEAKLQTLQGKPFYALISSKKYEQDGEVLIYSVVEDITQYLKVKEETQKFFVTLVELLPVGLAILDEEGRTVFVNTSFAKLSGYEKSELISANLHDLLIPTSELRERARLGFKKFKEGKPSALARKHVQTRLRRKDGAQTPVEIVFDEITFLGKRCFLGLVSDITERIALEERKLKEERTASILQVAGGLAHDLNNLLMVIKGHLELLELKLKDVLDLDKARHLQKVKDAFDRVSQRVLELFILSGRDLKRFEDIDLSKFIPEWVEFYLQGSEVKVEFSLEEGLKFFMDHAHLVAIIQNLVLNAKEAMKGRGVLRVSAYSEDDSVVFKFEDTGVGIPPHILPRIFDPGFSTKPHGTGLGLAVVKRVVDLYGGEISVESKVGEGTTFTIKLPKKQKKVFILDREEAKLKEKLLLRRILILEDEEEVRELLAEVLRDRGYEVEAFEEGDSAYQAFKSSFEQGRPFDLLLLDLTVPQGKGGVYLLERLTKDELLSPTTKVVLMTGYTPQEVSERAKHVRYDTVLYKPFSLDKLLALLEGGSL